MSSLTGDDIVKIIQACKDSQISNLEFGELKLAFNGQHAQFISVGQSPAPKNEVAPESTLPDETPLDIDPELVDLQEELLREMEIENLMIEDAESYEDMLAESEDFQLENALGESDAKTA